MKKTGLYLLISLLAFSTACKKNDLPPDQSSGSPVFYISAEVNGAPSAIAVQAGVNGYYMHSSHYHNGDSVYVYKAELSQNSGNAHGYSIALLINDYKVTAPNSVMKPDSALQQKTYDFNDGALNPLGYNASFIAEMPGADEYKWSFSGESSYEYNKSITHFFKTGGLHTVNLSVKSGQDSAVQHSKVIDVGSPYQANISFNMIQQTMLSFAASASYTSPATISSFEWDYGDGSTTFSAVTPNSEHAYTGNPGYYNASLTMSAGSSTFGATYQVPAFYTFAPHANFKSYITKVPNSKALSAITIIVTDPLGKVYSSADADQPVSSNFEIVSVENYKTNEAGHPTKKIKIRFNCTVHNGNESLNITNGEAVVAVSYQ